MKMFLFLLPPLLAAAAHGCAAEVTDTQCQFAIDCEDLCPPSQRPVCIGETCSCSDPGTGGTGGATGGTGGIPSQCVGLGDDCEADEFYVVNEGCLLRSSAVAADNVLSNPGFEGDAPLIGPIPAAPGFWQGDQSSQIGPNQGIDPVEGSFMLRCDATTPEGSTSGATACEILQAYELPDPVKERIAEGEALTARVTGLFNRVSGDTSIDTAFGVTLDAYQGEVSTFPTQFREGLYLERDPARLVDSDPCVKTWESITAEVSLNQESPVDFLGITVLAIENVSDGGEAEVEFDGHYFDAVSLTIIATP